ncbi:immunoglobulin superfamily member 10-like [Pecten maximus]|uniref:immunoglobulin superfamily member 10-like n=1 Tax=Pecten maximus TaxID=6579 RepID=UPI0014580AF2|nr:immunoglobulin superfamily member 10-like [Pecten maximus]
MVCGSDYMCSTYQTPMGPGDEIRFVVGCSSKQLCRTITGLSGNNMCSECCDTPLCNNKLCAKKTTTAPTTTTSLQTTTETTTKPSTTHASHIFHHPPVASIHHSHISYPYGSHFSMTCRFSGSPTPAVHWYFNGNSTLPSNSLIRKHTSYSALYISHSDVSDAGTYKCEVSNIYGTASDTTQLIITGKKPTFIERPPSHIDMVVSGDYSATCRASGLPQPQIHWGFNFPTHSMAALSALYTNNDQTTLYISDTPMELSGGYVICTYQNAYGSISTNMTLNVHQATTIPTTQQPTTPPVGHVHTTPIPLTISLPASIDVQIGSDVVIPCNATGSPTPQITWSQLSGRFPSNVVQHENKLYIAKASPTNSRIFMCRAHNLHGNTLKLIKVNVHGVPPSITESPASKNVTHGDTVILTCEATGDPSPTISWSWNPKANAVAVDDSSLKLIPGVSMTDAHLTINNVLELHSGVYVCTASNAYGTVTADASLNVLSAHVNVAPRLSVSPLITSVLYGSDVTINYSITGDPTPSISCLYNRSALPHNVRMTESQLVVNGATNRNSGNYQCNVHNIEGTDTVEFQIEVIGMSPSFITKPVTATVLFGTHSSLTCTATGVPTPNIRWEYRSVSGSTSLPPGTTQSSDHTLLTIKSTQDSGTFICHAENVYGQATTQASIYVKTGSLIG